MWKINRIGDYVRIAQAFDQFTDDFLELMVSENQASEYNILASIRSMNTPVSRLILSNPTLKKYTILLIQHPKRIEIAETYYSLIDNYNSILDGLISLPSLSLKLVRDCFEYFYDSLVDTESFIKEYLPHQTGKSKNNYRTSFGYEHKSCPYCDIRGITYHGDSSTDHFLTKSKIPLLAISSINLVVACSTCNDRLKNQTMLFPMVHPFFHQVADQIKLRFAVVYPPYSITAENMSTIGTEKDRVNNYCQLFRIDEQYTSRFRKIHNENDDIRREVINSYKMLEIIGPVKSRLVKEILIKVISSRSVRRNKQKGIEENSKLFIDYYLFLKKPKNLSRLVSYIISQLEYKTFNTH